MATTETTPSGTEEYCPTCDGRRQHHVHISLVTESTRTENASFSREPYRVAECLDCGTETQTRMNDA